MSETAAAGLRLLIRGDDAGSCQSANTAIAQACDGGLLRNVSVMACGPALDDAAALFAGRSDIAVGLHVTLNAEWASDTARWRPVLPIVAVPSLVDARGFFWHTPAQARERGAHVDEMLAEAEAQLTTAREAGLRICYLDEHMGVSWPWPELRAGLAALCGREGLVDAHAVPFLPDAAHPTGDPLVDWPARVEAARQTTPGDGTFALASHPGRDAPDMQSFALPGQPPGQIARERDAERRALTSEVFARACGQNNVILARYDHGDPDAVAAGVPAAGETPS